MPPPPASLSFTPEKARCPRSPIYVGSVHLSATPGRAFAFVLCFYRMEEGKVRKAASSSVFSFTFGLYSSSVAAYLWPLFSAPSLPLCPSPCLMSVL